MTTVRQILMMALGLFAISLGGNAMAQTPDLKNAILHSLKAGQSMGLRTSSRAVMHYYRVHEDAARQVLQEMRDAGDLLFVPGTNRYVLAKKHKAAA